MLGWRVELRSVPFQSIPRRSGPSWSHSGRIIAGHELVGEFGEVAHRDLKSISNVADGGPGGVGMALLDQGERPAGYAGLLTKSNLSEAPLFS